MYFDVSEGAMMNAGPFLGIKSDGSGHTLFKLPDEIAPSARVTLQAVSPDGVFYLLATDFKRYTLVAYKSDGSVKGMHSRDIPGKVTPIDFSVTNSGLVFFQGYVNSSDQREKSRKSFLALFDDSGALRKDLSDSAPTVNLKSLGDHPLEVSAAVGDDNNFYLLESDEVLVVNQSGTVARTLPFKKPKPDIYAQRIDASGSLVSIEMNGDERNPGHFTPISVWMLLLNSQTGERQADYVLDPSLSNTILCFSSKEGYSVLARLDNQAAKVLLPLR